MNKDTIKISIDASRLITTDKPTGVEVYCENIIQGLLTKSNDLILYTPKLIHNLPKEKQKVLSWPAKFLWSQIRLALELLIHPPHVFFSPGYVLPFLVLLNRKTKKVVTIHDVAFVHLPESYSAPQKWFLKLTTRQAVKFAYKIIVPSQATKNDLVKYFNCRENKIEVTYFGLKENLSRGAQTTGDSKIDASHGILRSAQDKLPQKQILYIGRVEDKKNIGNLIKAFKIFNQKYPDYKLILAGKAGVGFANLKLQIANCKFIDYKGYINQQEKEQLLRESSCLVLVSKYEGFGFPLLEGFNYALPVLAADIPMLREIGQNACLYVKPDSIQDIAEGLEQIIGDNQLRQKLIQAGQLRLKDFSWQSCIEQTYQILKH
jgi:glycosyltransferase involved in cell wall biosynthesis